MTRISCLDVLTIPQIGSNNLHKLLLKILNPGTHSFRSKKTMNSNHSKSTQLNIWMSKSSIYRHAQSRNSAILEIINLNNIWISVPTETRPQMCIQGFSCPLRQIYNRMTFFPNIKCHSSILRQSPYALEHRFLVPVFQFFSLVFD